MHSAELIAVHTATAQAAVNTRGEACMALHCGSDADHSCYAAMPSELLHKRSPGAQAYQRYVIATVESSSRHVTNNCVAA
jgi:hypothetical protein